MHGTACLFPIFRVRNLFKAKKERKAAISLVKLTEEFRMQVINLWLLKKEVCLSRMSYMSQKFYFDAKTSKKRASYMLPRNLL